MATPTNPRVQPGAPDPKRTVTMGRIVRFILKDGTERPAMIVEVQPEALVLRVFLRKQQDEPEEFFITERMAGSAPRRATYGDEPGCWRWPPR